ncbi:MAG: metallophosphoesterase [Bryobacteraceae bacterium]|nr:metallophosphoesterase [Bryobacteraceae bacterium]MDW8377032.1 metallophosphoesterase family protein [Bryobacterales bacterium]
MRRVAWMTDLHLNFLPPEKASAYFDQLNQSQADLILIGGDISEAPRLILDLSDLAARVRKPVYFVLGNQDYYRSSIAGVRAQVTQLCSRLPNLTYLSVIEGVELSPGTALVGHDGWGDATLGDFEDAIKMRDERLIEELAACDRNSLADLLRRLGREAAEHIHRVLSYALQYYDNVCLLTHVPPFKEACWFEGAWADERHLPRFACGSVGTVIQDLMSMYPRKQLTVLCGHTHSPGYAQILPNVHVWTGGVDVGLPKIQRMFWVP